MALAANLQLPGIQSTDWYHSAQSPEGSRRPSTEGVSLSDGEISADFLSPSGKFHSAQSVTQHGGSSAFDASVGVPSTPVRSPGAHTHGANAFNALMDTSPAATHGASASNMTEGLFTAHSEAGRSSEDASSHNALRVASMQAMAGVGGSPGSQSAPNLSVSGRGLWADAGGGFGDPPPSLDLNGNSNADSADHSSQQTSTPECSASLAIPCLKGGPQSGGVQAQALPPRILPSDRWGQIQDALGGLVGLDRRRTGASTADGNADSTGIGASGAFPEHSGHLAMSGTLHSGSQMDMMLPPPPSGPGFGDFELQGFGTPMSFGDASSALFPEHGPGLLWKHNANAPPNGGGQPVATWVSSGNGSSMAMHGKTGSGSSMHEQGAHVHAGKANSVPNLFQFVDSNVPPPQNTVAATVATPAASWPGPPSSLQTQPFPQGSVAHRKPQQPYTEVASGPADISTALTSPHSPTEKTSRQTPPTPPARSQLAAPQPPPPAAIPTQQPGQQIQHVAPRSMGLTPPLPPPPPIQQQHPLPAAQHHFFPQSDLPNLLDAPIATPPASGSTFAIRNSAPPATHSKSNSSMHAANGFTYNQPLPSSPTPLLSPPHQAGLHKKTATRIRRTRKHM